MKPVLIQDDGSNGELTWSASLKVKAEILTKTSLVSYQSLRGQK